MNTLFKAYFVECITNMHAGSGDANYGIVDKLVQRDPVTKHPTIHASSMKGALREYFEQKWGKEDKKVASIFGKESIDGNDSETGNFKFLNADLVALPVRCNYESYVSGINQLVATDINSKGRLLINKEVFISLENSSKIYRDNIPQGSVIYAEDITLTPVTYANPLLIKGFDGFSSRYATFNNTDFESISRNLPVIARNKLGEDNNLWYEEVVPHKTIFITYFGVTEPYFEDFKTVLAKDLIQIGGNASIGYGLCKFHEIIFNATA
jgi:CRISPR-associated protein Cmr4